MVFDVDAIARRITLALMLTLGMAGCVSPPLKTVVSTAQAPAAIGPYSQGIKSGNWLFLAGQIAIDPKTSQMNSGTIEEQTRQVLDNLRAVLEASAMSMDNVVSTTVYLKDVEDFTRMNTVYATFFKDKPPARATVQVARLPRDALVEISAIAVK
jgi:2-iminobutanoate/2-iminopropanoate deaminase